MLGTPTNHNPRFSGCNVLLDYSPKITTAWKHVAFTIINLLIPLALHAMALVTIVKALRLMTALNASRSGFGRENFVKHNVTSTFTKIVNISAKIATIHVKDVMDH